MMTKFVVQFIQKLLPEVSYQTSYEPINQKISCTSTTLKSSNQKCFTGDQDFPQIRKNNETAAWKSSNEPLGHYTPRDWCLAFTVRVYCHPYVCSSHTSTEHTHIPHHKNKSRVQRWGTDQGHQICMCNFSECKPNWYHHNGLCVLDCPAETYRVSDETKVGLHAMPLLLSCLLRPVRHRVHRLPRGLAVLQ